MIDKLRQLVADSKIDEAIKLIKLTEALQRQQIKLQVSMTETLNATLNATQQVITNNFNASETVNPVNNSTDIPNQANSRDIPKQNTLKQSDTVNSVNATQKTNIVNDNSPHNDNEKKFHEKRNGIDLKNKDRKKIRTDKSGD